MGHDKAQNCKVVSSKTTGIHARIHHRVPRRGGEINHRWNGDPHVTRVVTAVVSMKSTSSRPDDPFGQGMSLDITGKTHRAMCTK
jgi:hypothetical protein